jgi:hypothetical protein
MANTSIQLKTGNIGTGNTDTTATFSRASNICFGVLAQCAVK